MRKASNPLVELPHPTPPILGKLKDCLDWFLPARCMQCHAVTKADCAFCEECYQNLPFQYDGCERCGQLYVGPGTECGRCISQPPVQETTYYPFSYRSPISDEIQRLKYSERPELAKRLATLMADEIGCAGIELPDLMVPIPMHISRLRQRGYNQAGLMCKHLAERLGVAYDLTLLTKIKNTTPQVEMSLKQRKENIRNSFAATKTFSAEHIAVIDDVFTTGSTANEACRVLKSQGAKKLQVWTLAHTL